MSRILFLVNHATTLCHFRTELVEACLADGHEVVLSCPDHPRLAHLKARGCIHRDITLSRHGRNPLGELKLLANYKRLLKEVRPDLVLSYTIKPNIYGAIACRSRNIPIIATITGLGGALENGGLTRTVAISLYKYAFKGVRKVFFQNTDNLRFFTDRAILRDRYALLPGSGVNLDRFTPQSYPAEETVRFLFVGRVTVSKGIREYLTAAQAITVQYPHAEFHVCGPCEPDGTALLDEYTANGTVVYHGEVDDTRPLLRDAHCIVLPSYHEGMANALLEAAASARPVIASDIPGCREAFENSVSGYACAPRSSEDLMRALEQFIALPYEEKVRMGIAGRQKVEMHFDRRIVVEAYLSEVRAIAHSPTFQTAPSHESADADRI